MTADIRIGNALAVLRSMPEASVHCVITSPPYWGLRAYGRDPGMIGLEPTFDEHIENLLAVFREVRRVLRPDGTLWLNYGDAYARGDKRGSSGTGDKQASNRGSAEARGARLPSGMKSKDLMGMPWRVAFALQDDGWWLRSEIIWHKPNPMPESVTDRPTSAHEKLFLLSKSARYFYDAEAVRVPYNPSSLGRYDTPMQGTAPTTHQPGQTRAVENKKLAPNPAGANLRNVWTIATHAFRGWTETVDLVPLSASQALALVAEGNASVGDICHIVSPDCPAHAGFPDSVPKGFCDGLPDHLLRRMRGNGGNHAHAPVDAASDSALSPDHCPNAPSKPDCSGPSYSSSAKPSSTESRKTGHAPPFSPHAKSSGGASSDTGRTGPPQDWPASMPHDIGGSRSEGDISRSDPSTPSPEMAGCSVRKEGSEDCALACQCAYYRKVVSKSSHFATFPPALVEPCIRAGTSEHGVCPDCGAPWERLLRVEYLKNRPSAGNDPRSRSEDRQAQGSMSGHHGWRGNNLLRDTATTGWAPSCDCYDDRYRAEHPEPRRARKRRQRAAWGGRWKRVRARPGNPEWPTSPAIVLDPFAGAGTAGLVAERLGRDSILIELNPDYAEMARERIAADAPPLTQMQAAA